ncbi:hypothetical protein, partial [Deinococcus planocerae]|uniref:hypothetical protein n=1 Tax=Deinococcus planocerae TaxID=1737569 RepID=UPI001CA488B7
MCPRSSHPPAGHASLAGIEAAPASTPPRRPWWADRTTLLVLVPIVGAAWLPWWAVLGFALALALTRREEDARTVRVPLLLLGGGVGVVPLLPGLLGPEGALAFTRLVLTVLGGVVLISLTLAELEGGRTMRGLGGLAALLLLGPLLGPMSPLGLALGVLALPLVLLGASGAEERPPLRLGGGGWAAGRVLGAGLLAAAVVGLLTLALPGAGGRREATRTPPPTTVQERQEVAPIPPRGALPGRPRTVPPAAARGAPTTTGTDLVLLGGLLFILSLAFALWRMGGRVRAGPLRVRWWEVAALLGLLL